MRTCRNGYNFYHQYAQIDFTVLDRRMGTLEDLRNLVNEAHALDMYVIIDVAPWKKEAYHVCISRFRDAGMQFSCSCI